LFLSNCQVAGLDCVTLRRNLTYAEQMSIVIS
jgi:hypothetical protein